MKPLKLEMKAFGAYRNETIDFSDLQEESLFLISGPTGAGKSTIFDAMTYALYGKPSGTHKTEYDLVSDFAEEGERARVGLTFEIRGKAHYVQRGLEVKVNEGAKSFKSMDLAYYPLGEEEKTLSKKSDIDSKINQLIGLDYDQFKQTIMIPQGEFRELLTADSAKREAAFQEIFDTVFYKRFEETMNQKAKEAYGELKDLEKERDHQFDQLGHLNAPLFEEELASGHRHYQGLILSLEKEEKALKERIAQEKKEMDDLQKKSEALSKRITLAEQKNERFVLLRKRKEELAVLEKEEEKIKKKKELLTRLAILSRLSGGRAGLLREEKALESLEEKKKELKEQEEALVLAFQGAEREHKKRPQWQETLEKAQEERARLLRLGPLYGSLEGMKREIESLEREGKREEAGYQKLLEQRQRLTEKIQGLEKTLADSENVAGERITSKERGERLGKEKKALEVYFEHQTEVQAYEKRLVEAEEEKEKKEEQRKKAGDQLEALRRMHLAHQVYVLAEGLEEDRPCPVCGSLEHPAPATPTGEEERVSEALLEEKERALNKAEKALKEVTEALQTIRGQRDVKKAQAASQLEQVVLAEAENPKEALGRLLKEYEAERVRYKALLTAEKKREEDKKGLEAQKEALKELELALEKARGLKEERSRQLEVTRTRLLETRKQIPEDLPDQAAYEARIKALEEQIKGLREAIEAVEKAFVRASEALNKKRAEVALTEKNRLDQEKRREEAQRVFALALEKEDFPSREAFEKERADLEGIEAASLEKEVADHGEKKATIKTQVADLTAELEGHEPLDLQAMKEEREDLRAVLLEKADQDQKRVTDAKIMETVLKESKRLTETIEKREQAYQEMRTLADLALGRNSQKMHLNSYVLRIYLNRVLKAANARLKTMTGGRFTLYMAEHSTGKSKNAGLDLEVHDFYTGKKRSVKSLSGGESFKTAMAFALGVSDIIRHTAGGIQLNTLFIDEGFGTLDTESLDQAIEMLIELQADGRLIGIISHVPELKDRIETKLVIEQTSEGSKAGFSKAL